MVDSKEKKINAIKKIKKTKKAITIHRISDRNTKYIKLALWIWTGSVAVDVIYALTKIIGF